MTDYPTAGTYAFTDSTGPDYSGLRVDTGTDLDEPLQLAAPAPDADPATDPATAAPGSPARRVDIDDAPAAPGAEAAPGGSLAELLSAEFATFTVPTVTVAIPGRRGWALRFRLDWTEAQARERRRGAADPSSPDGLSAERIFLSTIADQCVAILRRDPDTGLDSPVTAPGSTRPLTFRDPALWPMLVHPVTKVRPTSAKAAVRCLLPVFTQLSTVGLDISRAAGQEDLADPFDRD